MTQPTNTNMQVDPAAGQKLQQMLTDEMQQVDSWLARSNDLSRQAPLGQNPVGEAMAAKFGNRANDGGTSLAGVLTSYKQVLQDSHDAVTQAMQLYQSTEQQVIESLRTAAGNQA